MSAAGARRAGVRRAMFLAQDGVTLCLTLRGLEQIGLLRPSLASQAPLAELLPEMDEAGFGALRVAVHGLCATGWVADPPSLDPATTALRWTGPGRAAAEDGAYLEVAELLAGFDERGPGAWTAAWSPESSRRFAELVARRRRERGAISPLVDAHLDGALLVPTMLSLHELGRLGGAAPALGEDESGRAMAALLADLGWLEGGQWTETGEAARDFAFHFGGVATYLPLLARLGRLYRGELTVVPDPDAGAPEWHVDRALNVRISAAAHRRYFADSEPLFRQIFDREPLAEQPRFVADMGCGRGSWLVHLHRLVAEQTLRGRRLGEWPLTMVGVDPDSIALREAESTLRAAGVPALLLRGDVTDPDGLARLLAEHGLAIEDGLHIRSFIDHERSFVGGRAEEEVPSFSSGVYLDRAGRSLSAAEVERDLVSHLRRWRRHVGRHGMVVLEAHCTAPAIVARNLGSMHGLAFDAHQAYSKQYPVDHLAFLECCRAAGLRSVPSAEIRYPERRPFVSISLNRLLRAGADDDLLAGPAGGAERQDSWRPPAGADLADGEALHSILYRGGDLAHPAAWHSAATGFVVRRAVAALGRRAAGLAPGEPLRVLDYGAGTGTATIELLKACRETGLERALEARGSRLEVHLLDLPSSWYAKGYELLSSRGWTRFHSLRAADGSFRALPEVLGGRTVDVALANMVFHLIPAAALARTVDGLAESLAPGGSLLWSAPDLGPAIEGAVLLHDPNRLLRERWLALLADELPPPPGIADAVAGVRAELDGDAMRRAQERADRRIRPRPLAEEVTAALARRFDGETRTASYEMVAGDVVRGLLVPSNQSEFIPEIADRPLREAVIRELMENHVLPELRSGPAGTGLGLNLQWSLGEHLLRAQRGVTA